MGCQAGYVPAGITTPYQLIGSPNWKLTLPINTGHAGNPDEYSSAELQAGASIPPYFMLNKYKNAVLFRAHCGGVTTGGSDYPRSELREMTNNGADEASWNMASGTHSMLIDQVITHTAKNKRDVVAGQIHDASDDVIRCMVRDSDFAFGVSYNDGAGWHTLDPAYQLGRRFKLYIKAYSGGIVVKYGVAGQATVTAPTISPSGAGNYFKAGCYTNANTSTDAASDYGEVGIYSVSVRHW